VLPANYILSSSCQWHCEETPSTPAIPAGAHEETLRVSGMGCSEEVAAIERAVKPLKDVEPRPPSPGTPILSAITD
jgi:hypothetical protein